MTTHSGERTLRDRVGEQVYLNWQRRTNPGSDIAWPDLDDTDREWHRESADALLAVGVVPTGTVVEASSADRDRLAGLIDPVAFDPARKRPRRPAATLRLADRRLAAHQAADRLLAAGVIRTEGACDE